MQFDDIVTAGNQCLVAAFDGYHVIRQFRSAQLMQRNIQNLCFLTHLGAYQNQRAAAEFPPLAYPAHTDRRYNLFCRKHFRVDKRVHPQLLEEFLVLGQQVFVVVNAAYGLYRTQIGSKHAGSDVTAFIGSNGDKEVGFSPPYFFQSFNGSGRGSDSHQVEVGAECTHPFFVVVH